MEDGQGGGQGVSGKIVCVRVVCACTDVWCV